MKKKILVIDDEPDIVRTISIALEIKGYEVITASDGYEGIYKAKKPGIDLMILDLKLPGLPGEEICKELRGEKAFEDLPIIMLTAKDTDTDKIVGKILGANYYIRKPFDMEDILIKIKTLLDKKQKK